MLNASTSPDGIKGGCVLGRYELLLPIATGGMAVVWAARLRGSRGFQKIVAIKTIRPDLSDDPSFEDMLLDEASLASRIRHPHVVEIHDLGDENGVPYIVMEWIDGEPLHVLVKEASKSGGIPLPLCVRIGTQLCAGLHAAHELRDVDDKLVGLVHRDVSPQNVLVSWDGVAKLVDFGIAKAVGRVGGVTMAGTVKGKTAYLAPEQILGGEVDRRSDVFATGTLLYAITTGKHPFRAEVDYETIANIVEEKPPVRPGKLVPGFPAQLEKVIMTALEKDPAKRFQTASDMLRVLDHALPGNKRVSTDEDVAAFFRPLVAERFESKRARIKKALRDADDRLAGLEARKSFTSEAMDALIEVRGPAGTPATGVRARDAASSPIDTASPGPDTDDAHRSVSGIIGRLRAGADAPGGQRATVRARPMHKAQSPDDSPADKVVIPPSPSVPELAHATSSGAVEASEAPPTATASLDSSSQEAIGVAPPAPRHARHTVFVAASLAVLVAGTVVGFLSRRALSSAQPVTSAQPAVSAPPPAPEPSLGATSEVPAVPSATASSPAVEASSTASAPPAPPATSASAASTLPAPATATTASAASTLPAPATATTASPAKPRPKGRRYNPTSI